MSERVPFRATEAGSRYLDRGRLPVSLLLDNVRSMYNVGSIFRTADGAGVERIFLSGITARPPKPGIAKTALGAEETVPWHSADDPAALVQDLKSRGHEIAAVETSLCPVDIFDWSPRYPVLLVFGHEVEGVQPRLLDLCDTQVRIPMLGRKHSLNVSTAAGIVLYELLRKFHRWSEAQ